MSVLIIHIRDISNTGISLIAHSGSEKLDAIRILANANKGRFYVKCLSYFLLIEQEDQRDWDRNRSGQKLRGICAQQHGHCRQADIRRPLGSQRYGGKEERKERRKEGRNENRE
jgi:hypothetical protein